MMFRSLASGFVLMVVAVSSARAHGPLFSPAPETIWKGGTELTLGMRNARASGVGGTRKTYAPFVEAEYGITANFEVGLEVPYVHKDASGRGNGGVGNVAVDVKYQFWKRDLPGAQYKASAFVKVALPTGDDDGRPPVSTGSTDVIAGLTTGYEARRWYWFASSVYRANVGGAGGLEVGDQQFLNLVGGIRPVLGPYDRPDTVLMVELNWERSGRDRINRVGLADSGGWGLFISPVFWWTYRQWAVRGGIQIPLASDLRGRQPSPDYRARLELVYHF